MDLRNLGLDFDAIRARMDAEEYAASDDGFNMYERRVYLGTVFGLTPSGKYYTPWANSNVAGCPGCGGRGSVATRFKRRVLQKRANRSAAAQRQVCPSSSSTPP